MFNCPLLGIACWLGAHGWRGGGETLGMKLCDHTIVEFYDIVFLIYCCVYYNRNILYTENQNLKKNQEERTRKKEKLIREFNVIWIST